MKDHYFISTPYIDAYQTSDRYSGFTLIDFDDFVSKMLNQCWDWGEKGIGRALLTNKNLPMHEDHYVLAFGWFGSKNYVMVYLPADDDHLIVEADWDKTWNVT